MTDAKLVCECVEELFADLGGNYALPLKEVRQVGSADVNLEKVGHSVVFYKIVFLEQPLLDVFWRGVFELP